MKPILIFTIALAPLAAVAQPADSALVRWADSLVQVSRKLTNQRQYEEAQRTNDAAERAALERLGKESPTYANCLFNHGRILQSQGKLEESEGLYLAAIQIQEAAPGTDPQHLAASLNNLGIVYRNQGRLEEAEPVYLKVRDIREKIFTKAHPQFAAIDNNLGVLYSFMYRYRDAEKYLLEAKGIWENDIPTDSAQYANVLDNLGDVYWKTGRFDEAEPLYLQAKNIREKVLGSGHPDYARLLNDLANLYSDMTRFEESERYYLRAMELQVETSGRENSDYAWSLNNLGLLYKELGRFEEGERCLMEAREVWAKAAGTQSPEYAACLDNLASLYYKLGLFDLAKPLYQEALDIRAKAAPGSPEHSFSLNNLAVLHMANGAFEEAGPLYLEAKANLLKSEGPEGENYAWSLNNLGILNFNLGRYAAADSLLSSAKSIRGRVLGKQHPLYANTLEDLGILYQKMGNPDAALALFQEAKSVFGKAFGHEHPRYEECIGNLAVFYRQQGQPHLAGPLVLESNHLQRRFLANSTRYLSERELAAYAASFANDLDGLFSFAKQHPAAAGQFPAVLFDNAVFYKGFLLTAANQVKHLAMRDSASSLRYELLTSYHRRLAVEYSKPMGERIGVADLEQKTNDLEKELVRAVAGFGQAIRQVPWEEVRSSLKPGEAAVEFVQFRFLGPEPTDSVFYCALILRPGEEAPRCIQLCEERSLDSLFGTGTARKGDYANALYSYQERGARPVGQPRKSLYELLWQPLESVLTGVGTVYFSPSGLMHRLNLGAIPIPPMEGMEAGEEEKLADRFNLVQLGSTRQLVAPADPEVANQEVLLVGGVRYELDSAAISERQISVELLASRGPQDDSQPNLGPVPSQRGSAWSFLNWTNKEVSSLLPIVKAAGMVPDLKVGNAATEESFKLTGRGKPSPRTIHLATHGFFFPDPSLPPAPTKDGVTSKTSPLAEGSEEVVFKLSDQPMIRSGLVLAGGNYAWLTGQPMLPDMEDGILTAYEISQMDLSHTELVALSACETGLGDIKGNEGVYGLQRAFKIAGAKYIVMSLWEVPDEQTKKLMTLFYSKWLEDRMPIPDAFRAAQKEMREIGFSPYQWAGFVLVQ